MSDDIEVPKPDKEKGLLSTMKRLNSILDREEELELKKARKRFQLPRKIRAGTKKKMKQGKIIMALIHTNGLITMDWVKIDDEMIYDKKNKAYRIANSRYLMNFLGKYPMVLVHESSMTPVSPQKLWEDIPDKNLIEAQRYLIKLMKLTQAELKKGISGVNPKIAFILVIGGIIVLYFIMSAFGVV